MQKAQKVKLLDPKNEHARHRPAITYRPIAILKLDPKNPRIHSSRQIAQIAKSIDAFGFNVPVLVDANLKVVAGHGRIAAAQLLGLTEVPTILLDHLSEAQTRAFMIADNRLTETSAWDELLLAEQLKELAELNLDFSLEVTGFKMGEIDLRIEGLKPAPAAEKDPADQLPAVGPKITQTGDLWILGWHRILCASALEASAYALLCGKSRAAMVFTDPAL